MGRPKFPASFNPLLNHDLGIAQRILPSGIIGRTTCRLSNFRDERVFVNVPVQVDLVPDDYSANLLDLVGLCDRTTRLQIQDFRYARFRP
jgi:hypothetical protein